MIMMLGVAVSGRKIQVIGGTNYQVASNLLVKFNISME